MAQVLQVEGFADGGVSMLVGRTSHSTSRAWRRARAGTGVARRLSVSTSTPWPWSLLIAVPGVRVLVPVALRELLERSSFDGRWLVARCADVGRVPERVHVPCHPCNAPVLDAVDRAFHEVVALGSRGMAPRGRSATGAPTRRSAWRAQSP